MEFGSWIVPFTFIPSVAMLVLSTAKSRNSRCMALETLSSPKCQDFLYAKTVCFLTFLKLIENFAFSFLAVLPTPHTYKASKEAPL